MYGIILGGVLLAGCSDPIKDEQERLDMVKQGGSVDDVCRQSRKVADAALAKKDEQYRELAAIADVDCLTAQMHPGESYDQVTNTSAIPMMADNME